MLRKAVPAERQPYSGALLLHLEAQPVGLNELGLHIRHPAYRPDPTIPQRLLINGDRNDVETRVLFASDVMPHFA